MSNLNHKNLNQKSKTFVLATMITFVAIFASSLINFWLGFNFSKTTSVAHAAASIPLNCVSQDANYQINESGQYNNILVNDLYWFKCTVKDSYTSNSKKNPNLSFYQSTLGWDIDCEPGNSSSSTWYLGREYKKSSTEKKYYNNNLPVLRQFMGTWDTITFKIRFNKNSDNKQFFVGQFNIPSGTNDFTITDKETGTTPFSVIAYGYKFTIGVKDKDNTITTFKPKFTKEGTTVYADFVVEIPMNEITFMTPRNSTDGDKTDTSKGYWEETYTITDRAGNVTTSTPKKLTNKKSYSVIETNAIYEQFLNISNNIECWSNNEYVHKAALKFEFTGIAEKETISRDYTLKFVADGYKYTKHDVTTNESWQSSNDCPGSDSYAGRLDNNKQAKSAWKLTQNVYVHLAYELEYYNMALGYNLGNYTSSRSSSDKLIFDQAHTVPTVASSYWNFGSSKISSSANISTTNLVESGLQSEITRAMGQLGLQYSEINAVFICNAEEYSDITKLYIYSDADGDYEFELDDNYVLYSGEYVDESTDQSTFYKIYNSNGIFLIEIIKPTAEIPVFDGVDKAYFNSLLRSNGNMKIVVANSQFSNGGEVENGEDFHERLYVVGAVTSSDLVLDDSYLFGQGSTVEPGITSGNQVAIKYFGYYFNSSNGYKLEKTKFALNIEGTKLPTSSNATIDEIKQLFANDYTYMAGSFNSKVLYGWEYKPEEISGKNFKLSYKATSLTKEECGYSLTSNSGVDTWTYTIRKNSVTKTFWFKINYKEIPVYGETKKIITKVAGNGDWFPDERENANLSLPIVPIWIDKSDTNEDVEIHLINQKNTVNNGSTKVISGVIDENGNVKDEIVYNYSSNKTQRFPYSYDSAFYTLNDNIQSTSLFGASYTSSAGLKDPCKYGFYKYGHEIIEYYVTAKYLGNEIYLKYSSGWISSSTKAAIDIYDLVTYSSTSNKLYAITPDTFEYLLNRAKYFVGSSIGVKLYIEPVWQAVEIEAKTDASNSFRFNNDYALNAPADKKGTTFAYYTPKTGSGNAIVQTGKWDYYNISKEDYNYQITVKTNRDLRDSFATRTFTQNEWNAFQFYKEETTIGTKTGYVGKENILGKVYEVLYVNEWPNLSIGPDGSVTSKKDVKVSIYIIIYLTSVTKSNYKIDLDPYYVENICKLNLLGADGFTPAKGGDYNSVVQTSSLNDEYTFKNWVNPTYNNSKPIEIYTTELKSGVHTYQNAIGDGVSDLETQNKYYLRKVFSTNGTDRYIFVAHGHKIGNLIVEKNGFNNVGWSYNGADENPKTLYTNSKFDATTFPASESEKYTIRNYDDSANWQWYYNIDGNNVLDKNGLLIVFGDGGHELVSIELIFNTIKQTDLQKAHLGYVEVEITNAETGAVEKYHVEYNAALGDMAYYKYSGSYLEPVEGIFVIGGGLRNVVANVYSSIRLSEFKNSDGYVVTDTYADTLGYNYTNSINDKFDNTTADVTVRFSLQKPSNSQTTTLTWYGKSTELTNNSVVTVDSKFDCIDYDTNIGYTIKNQSSNNAAYAKTQKYYPNGESSSAYQDVLIKLLNKVTVEGFDLTTLDLEELFGNDYASLTADESTFAGWLVDKTVLQNLGYTQKPGQTKTTDKWYLNGKTQSNVWVYKGWIKFDCSSEFETLNKKRVLVDKVTKIYAYGDFVPEEIWADSTICYKGAYKLPIIPSWNSKHDVSITDKLAYKTDSIGSNRMVEAVLYNGNYSSNVTYKLNGETNVDFVYSNASAFLQPNQITSSSLYNAAGKYGLFKYGHEIAGYEISFRYSGVNYYAYLNSLSGANVEWKAGMSASSVSVDSGTLSKTTLKQLIQAFNNWTQGDFVLASTTINVVPVWARANILLQGSAKDQFANNRMNVLYGDRYSISRGNCATLGKSIAYYTTPSNCVVVCDSGVSSNQIYWDYLDIPSVDFKYNNGVYTLPITKFETDNIYKVTLSNFRGNLAGDYGTDIEVAAPSKALNKNGDNSYYSYSSWLNASYDSAYVVEKYAKEFAQDVENYITGVDNNDSNFYLRKVYSVGGETYIFVANAHTIGNLVFHRDYFDLVAWLYNGQDGSVAYITEEYVDRANGPHQKLLDGKTIKNYNSSEAENKIWTIDIDNSNTQNPTLFALYYRPAYELNVNTINTELARKEFVGYAIISVKDSVVAAGEDGSATCTYVAKYNSDESVQDMVLYKINNTGEITDLHKLSKAGLGKYEIVDSVIIYSGCDVDIFVVDQSKVEDLSATNEYYDNMIGYKFSNAIDCTINGTAQSVKARYDYTISFNTKQYVGENPVITGLLSADNINLESSDEIVVDILFEPIKYSTTIGLTIADAGEMHITNNTNYETKTTKTPYTLTSLKRNNSYKIYYYAYAGYGLSNNNFTLVNSSVNVLKTLSDSASDKENQTYDFNLTGSWLRMFYYKNGPYNVENDENATYQFVGNININNILLEFDVRYLVFVGDENVQSNALNNGLNNIVSAGWKLGENLTWTLSQTSANDADGNFATYYYSQGEMYAIISSWARQPRNISNRNKFAKNYAFLLKTQPIESYTIDTDNLFDMVETNRGIIVPKQNRTMYLAMQVMPMYKIVMQIAINENDTNCTERTLTVNNGNGNSVALIAKAGHSQDTTTFIYTYLGLENTIASTYDEKYYIAVNYTNATTNSSVESPFTTDQHMTLKATFTPKELPINLSFNYNNEQITQEQALTFLVGWNMPVTRGQLNNIQNAPKEGFVVTNDTIEFVYTVSIWYHVVIAVNNDSERVDAANKIYIKNEDYQTGKIDIVVNINDKQRGMIILKVVGDNSNGTTFHDADNAALLEFANLYINGVNSAKSGIFIEGYPVSIKFADIPKGYRYMGLRKDNGGIDSKYVVEGSVISITNGVRPANMTEDEYVSSIEGVYYAVFQKVVVNTEMTLTAKHKNNYSYRSDSQQAVWDLNKLVLTKGVSVNDTITFNRIKNLENEELDYYYYIDSTGEHQVYDNKIVITNELLEALDGEFKDKAKTLILGVVNKLKYYITINIDEANYDCLQTLLVNDEPCNKLNDLTYISKYYYENTIINLKVESINKEKYSIKVTGDYGFSGAQIDNKFSLTQDANLIVSIYKNTFAMSVQEKLFADIVELNTNNPQTLTGDKLINKNSDNNSTLDGTKFVYQNQTKVDIKQADGEGNNKKLLTQLVLADENLSIQFNIDWNKEDVSNCFVVKNSAGEQLVAETSASRDSANSNKINLTVVVDSVTYSYSFELLSSNNVQLTFVGVGNCNLTLIYTSIKLITVS